MDKRAIASNVSFGARTAEDETDDLEQYFVETDEWRKLYQGDVDIVYGPKGSGKSALYSLLMRRQNALFDRQVLTVPAENVRGALVFQDLVAEPPHDEEEIRRTWKLYFLSLIGHTLREYGIGGPSANRLHTALEDAGLLPVEWTLKKGLVAVRSYLARFFNIEGVQTGIELDPVTGQPSGITGKVCFSEPTAAQRKLGFISADELLEIADKALKSAGYQLWVVLDRLDVAFAATPELERSALRALFRVYLDALGLEHISIKIFLRDDIWRRISEGGFREASHVTRTIAIRWHTTTLLNLTIRRLLRSDTLVREYGIVPDDVLDSVEEQKKLFYRLFPDQIDSGPNKPATFDWILSRVADGSKENVPRELIHLLSEIRRVQIERFSTGYAEPEGETLFERITIRESLPEVSRVRLVNTLYAEYPDVKPWLEALEREKTEQFPDTLATIWGVSEEEASQRADRLVQVGFFERRGPKLEPSFWVPFLYRPALELSQGAARPKKGASSVVQDAAEDEE